MKEYYVYIATNHNRSLYIGVTNDLARRMYEHKHKLNPGFSSKYNINKLVYYESTPDVNLAITSEKYLKGKKREYKIDLIEQDNPTWSELPI